MDPSRRQAEKAKHNLIVDYDHESREWSVQRNSLLEPLRKLMAQRLNRAIARQSHPNNLGNYRGKRTPRPAGKALSPRERLARLQAHFLACRMTYRNAPTARGASPASMRAAELSTTQRQIIFHAA